MRDVRPIGKAERWADDDPLGCEIGHGLQKWCHSGDGVGSSGQMTPVPIFVSAAETFVATEGIFVSAAETFVAAAGSGSLRLVFYSLRAPVHSHFVVRRV